jgi:hypothetical protein
MQRADRVQSTAMTSTAARPRRNSSASGADRPPQLSAQCRMSQRRPCRGTDKPDGPSVSCDFREAHIPREHLGSGFREVVSTGSAQAGTAWNRGCSVFSWIDVSSSSRRPELCRFSDADNDEVCHTLGGRRRKSAKARNRGGVGRRRCRRLYGDLAAASGWASLDRTSRRTALPPRMGVSDGRNERSGRCRGELAVPLRPDLSTASKRRLCGPRASRNGERHWVGGSLETAS